LLFYVSLYVAASLRNLRPDTDHFLQLAAPFTAIFIFWILLLFIFDFYKKPPYEKKLLFFRNLFIFFLSAFVSGVIYFYFYPLEPITPKTILILTIVVFITGSTIWRYLLTHSLELKKLTKKFLIVGEDEEIKKITDINLKKRGYFLVATYDIDDQKGDIFDKKMKKDLNKVDFAVVGRGVDKSLSERLPMDVSYIDFLDFYENLEERIPLVCIDNLWILKNLADGDRGRYMKTKRVLEIPVSVVGLIMTAIISPLIFLLIKIDSPGPVIYKQVRRGYKEKEFVLYKFRTMTDSNKDKKVTRIGRLLRKLKIDELPQFWNVLKGDLSFIGPRPEWIRLAEKFEENIPFYSLRYMVKPGITGWAQINCRGTYKVGEEYEKLSYDFYYLKNYSPTLDLIIILKTVRALFL